MQKEIKEKLIKLIQIIVVLVFSIAILLMISLVIEESRHEDIKGYCIRKYGSRKIKDVPAKCLKYFD